MSTEETKTEKSEVDIWLEELNKVAEEHANAMSTALKCEIEPFIFVVEPLKDAAIGFFKKPDAKQSFKILRIIGENYESGVQSIAQAQLVRQDDLIAAGIEGSASDPRFMDANGNSDPVHSKLNLSLLMRAQTVVTILSDQFKKK